MIRRIYLRPQVSRFVLLFVGRTGSTHVISSLNSHPEIVALRETLVEFGKGQASEQLDWVRQFLTPKLVGRTKAIGFKTKLVDVLDRNRFGHLLQESKCHVLFMRRRNHVKAVVSRLNGQRLWEKYGRWNLTSEEKQLPPFAVDLEQFDEYLNHRVKVDEELESYIQRLSLPTLPLNYEELLANEEDSFARIFSFLKVRPWPIKGNTSKGTSDDLRAVVLNFDDLRSQYVGTVFEPMFDEVIGKRPPERVVD